MDFIRLGLFIFIFFPFGLGFGLFGCWMGWGLAGWVGWMDGWGRGFKGFFSSLQAMYLSWGGQVVAFSGCGGFINNQRCARE